MPDKVKISVMMIHSKHGQHEASLQFEVNNPTEKDLDLLKKLECVRVHGGLFYWEHTFDDFLQARNATDNLLKVLFEGVAKSEG